MSGGREMRNRQVKPKKEPITLPKAGFFWTKWHVTGLLVVLAFSATINTIGINWGRTGLVSWQPDSIEGIVSVSENQRLFGEWSHKYPRGHFLINAAFYQPLLKHWEKNPVTVRTTKGEIISQVLTIDRLALLARVSRWISVTMGTTIVLATFLVAMLLFNDYLASLLAALALSLLQLFVFYSHTGTVDIPYIFWFTLGLYWAVKASYVGKWHHFILAGLFCGYSVGTKEPAAGYIMGLGIATAVAMIHKSINSEHNLKKAVLSVFSLKVLAATVVFFLVFAVLNGFLAGPDEFLNRVRFWSAVPAKCNTSYTGQVNLLGRSASQLYYGMGWPLLALGTVSVLYCCKKYPIEAIFCIAPLVVFYALIITRIKFVCPRFLLAGYPGLAVLIGKTSADWLRWKYPPFVVRILPIGLVYALSLLYCIALDLELLNDTRIQTETWFAGNVSRNRTIGLVFDKIYSPRLGFMGYRVICPWRPPDNPDTTSSFDVYPEYLVVTNDKPQRTDGPADDKFREELINGDTGYKKVISFRPKYMYPAKTIFGLAGWPTKKNNFQSPEIIVFKKQEGFFKATRQQK